jgi:predicted aspartyl protease
MRHYLKLGTALLPLCAAMLWSQAASAACVVKRYATLDVAMEDGSPVTKGEINGHPVRLVVASGAFYSVVTADVARAAKLSVKGMSTQWQLSQGGKSVPSGIAFIDLLKFGSWTTKSVNFIVAGSFDAVDGQIGQNILGRRDVEYDLGHGAVRLTYTDNCIGQVPVYWAGALPIMNLPIEQMDDVDKHTYGTVLVNGIKLRAMFHTAAGTSAITQKGAKKLGIMPAGDSMKVDSVDIGGETLRGATFRVGEGDGGDTDMIVGLDFFLAHRIYVANEMHRMYFTYGSGPVFGVVPAPASAAQ